MVVLGADVEALDAEGRLFATAGRGLVQSATALTAAARTVTWLGPDAVGFRNVLDTEHAPRLRRVGAVMDDLARALEQQAQQQRTASETGGGFRPAGVPIAAASVAVAQVVRSPASTEPPTFHPDDINNDGRVDDAESGLVRAIEKFEMVIGKYEITLAHLDDGYVPQGQGDDEGRDDILTSYNNDDHVLLSIQDRRTGYESVAVELGGLDGNTPAKGGGVATDGTHVYLADSSEIFIYTRDEIDRASAEGRPAVPVEVVPTDHAASFLTLYDGHLYVGEFSSNLAYGDYRNGQPELVKYEIDSETGAIEEVGRQDIPYFAQGAAVTDEGIYFSTSFGNWGPISPTSLVFQEFGDVEDFDLESPEDADRVHDLGYFAEGINVIDGELWVTYESGADEFLGDDGWQTIRRIDLGDLDGPPSVADTGFGLIASALPGVWALEGLKWSSSQTNLPLTEGLDPLFESFDGS